MTKLTFETLNKSNITDVLRIKHNLFPESSSDEDYDKYFNDEVKSNYYLIRLNNIPCATIGWYDFDNANKDAFVGWFGVLPEYQGKGIGKECLKYILNEVKRLEFKYLRVYTDKIVNLISTKMYDKTFDLREDYLYPDKIGNTKNFVIYTKFLTNEQEKWNDRPLNEDENYNF